MKRAIIVHGWDYDPKMNWYPWLKKELEKIGFKVTVPAMPNSPEPQIEKWISHLKKAVGKLDEETYFVGHSIGCQTILRYLEKENFNGKIPGIVFVAGWLKLANLEGEEVEKLAKPWLETPIDFNKVKQKISTLTVFLSSNDPYNFLKENESMFKEKLGAKVIVEKNKGHFTLDDGVDAVPSVVASIKEMSS